MGSNNKLCLYNFGVVDTILSCDETVQHHHHPDVLRWMWLEFQFPAITVYKDRHMEQARVQRNCTEPGIGGSTLSDTEADQLYLHWMRRLNNWEEHPVRFFHRLQAKATQLVNKKLPPMTPYWCAPIRTQGAFEQLARHVVQVVAGDQPPPYTFSWVKKAYPVSVAAYYPSSRTMAVHQWAIDHFRRCDVVLLILHEILGHHWQESVHPTHSSEEAEGCAMRSERLGNSPVWQDEEGVASSLAEAVRDWELFRVLRACVDLRLHSREVKKVYPAPAVTLWTQYPVMGSHLAELSSELHRCASLPAQALGYVLERATYTGCIM